MTVETNQGPGRVVVRTRGGRSPRGSGRSRAPRRPTCPPQVTSTNRCGPVWPNSSSECCGRLSLSTVRTWSTTNFSLPAVAVDNGDGLAGLRAPELGERAGDALPVDVPGDQRRPGRPVQGRAHQARPWSHRWGSGACRRRRRRCAPATTGRPWATGRCSGRAAGASAGSSVAAGPAVDDVVVSGTATGAGPACGSTVLAVADRAPARPAPTGAGPTASPRPPPRSMVSPSAPLTARAGGGGRVPVPGPAGDRKPAGRDRPAGFRSPVLSHARRGPAPGAASGRRRPVRSPQGRRPRPARPGRVW